MRLIKTQPSLLSEYILFIYSAADSPAPAHHPVTYLPDGTLELIINLGDPVLHSRNGKNWVLLPDILITGLFGDKNFYRFCGEIYWIGIVFKPGYAHLFMNDNLEQFKGCSFAADLILGKEINELPEHFKYCLNEGQKHRLLETIMAARISKRKKDLRIPGILHSIELIDLHNGNIGISRLSKDVCMSERNFRRLFNEFVGMNPKHYARITRIKSFLKSARSFPDQEKDLIPGLGYIDRSHFINDFKMIAGISPSQFLAQMNDVSSQFNSLV